ncbi:MAG: family 10 glycosylhydrolase [Clostridia bacterium]|nr:family 10 glycosylhydrolase [Clostridia bacterium]
MKKAGVLFALFILLCGCAAAEPQKEEAEAKEKIFGVWISCYELEPMLAGGNFKEEFSAAAGNSAAAGMTDAFVHVRAFGDSLFPSRFYPQNENAARYDFDLLRFMIDCIHNAGMRFHAWINPFRDGDGSFLSPASAEVQARILGGIREITEGYGVDGIHFDDYFYTEKSSDAADYGRYRLAAAQPLSIEEYRTANISRLIAATKSLTAAAGITFSVSPAADTDKNKNVFFADVAEWCKNKTVDIIIPQLYFGFEYPDSRFCFDNLLAEWKELCGDNVRLVIGVAAYKLGTDSVPDTYEWKNGADILARQTEICVRDPDLAGICYFSYSYLFAGDGLHKTALSGVLEYTAPENRR